MRLKTKVHKKASLQDSFRNFDKYHGFNPQKSNKGIGKYYKWQKVLDREKLIEAMKSQPLYQMSLEESRTKQKENSLPERIFKMKAPFFNSPKIRRLANITNEELAESQVVKAHELPLELRNIMMEIPLSEEIEIPNIVNLKNDSEPSRIIEEKPLAVEPSSEPEPELERVVRMNLNETLDKITVERPSLSEKQMIRVGEKSSPAQKLSKSQPLIVNPYIESAKRLEEMTESIQKRVRNLNEKLSVTKSSISKIKEARTNSAKSTPVSLFTGEPLMRLDLNSFGKQSGPWKKEEAPISSSDAVSKENLGDSRNHFAKPSCQKSSICSAGKTSSKQTPFALKEFLELQPSAEKGKPSEQHIRERSSEKKILDQSWLTDSGIPIRLNKAEVLRMEYIRKKTQTPTKVNIVENYCALNMSNEKRGSEAKAKLEEL